MSNIFKSQFGIDHPVIGLSPMDGVTDAPFRFITKKYGNPDLMVTEFVSVNGLCVGNEAVYSPFIYDKTERPIIAQVFGNEPELFYNAAIIVASLGFDGIDINMGCPAKSVANSGSGAGLIRTPDIAKALVISVKAGVKDWENGKNVVDLDIPERNKEFLLKRIQNTQSRKRLSVSVKTRIGYDQVVIEDWVKHLAEVHPDWITIHGRTLKQMYTGSADWDSIGKAVQIISDIPVLGNGDVKNIYDADEKIKKYGVAGVLIGRASYGNPWVFARHRGDTQFTRTVEDLKRIMLEHCELFVKVKGVRRFYEMRKHLGWYCKGFPGAKEMRLKLVRASNLDDVKTIIFSIK